MKLSSINSLTKSLDRLTQIIFYFRPFYLKRLKRLQNALYIQYTLRPLQSKQRLTIKVEILSNNLNRSRDL